MLSTLFARFLPDELEALDPVARLAAHGRTEYAATIAHLEDVYRDIVREAKSVGYLCDVTSRDLEDIRDEVRRVRTEAARQWAALGRPLPVLQAGEMRTRSLEEPFLAPIRAASQTERRRSA
jgi:hypothetical protein